MPTGDFLVTMIGLVRLLTNRVPVKKYCPLKNGSNEDEVMKYPCPNERRPKGTDGAIRETRPAAPLSIG